MMTRSALGTVALALVALLVGSLAISMPCSAAGAGDVSATNNRASSGKGSGESSASLLGLLLTHNPAVSFAALRKSQNVTACVLALSNPKYWPKMLTASGLSINSLGDYEQCVHNYNMEYCVLDGHAHQLAQGVCMPPQCTQQELTMLLYALFAMTPAELGEVLDEEVQPLWDEACNQIQDPKEQEECEQGYQTFREDVIDSYSILRYSEPEMKCGEHKQTTVTAGFVVMLIICLLIIILATIQACRETRVLQGFTEEEKQMLIVSSVNTAPDSFDDGYKESPLLFRAFSIKANLKELLSSSPARTLKSLDGLRAISMFGIILGHTINFQLPGFVGVQNPEEISNELNTWSTQFLISQNFSVDTFFVLSGLLTAYVFIRKFNAGRRIPVFMGMVLRYLRVTPLLAFIVGAYACFFRYFGHGPLWYRFLQELDNCKTGWWQHLLYINNFYPVDYKDQCVPWAWYLADDMQFSIIGLMLLGLYRYSKRAMYTLTWLLVLCGPIATGLVTSHYNVTLTEGDSQNLIYDKPYTRCSAYAIGLLCGCMLANHTEAFRRVSPLTGITSLFVSVGGLLTIMYITAAFNWSSSAPNWTDTGMFVYQALCRPAWSVLLCTLIITCASGYGYAVNWLLTLPFWEPLARLTFAAYLIHPALIRMVYYQRTQLFTLNPVEYSTYFVGFLTAAYVVASVLFIVVEQPSAVFIGALKGGR
ncbi:hypothetical protein PTSG_03249 [Salpingoeca rosetta]|uniref:Acyltransferase 3 domain-containing protein n=1 Tax=Salpingoeca rosetta (strain ATCC 50818 / BSB-021) TaxID=946362 RepID=F2U4M9_SALR5|nr:uncharacterized protein PTSG_03249 [Salpingoeca rosetta]EGD82595.1 hypothetical protein PTSG_03249 [Salpingoeca rosetta]|eukprot:XP_004995831.1 hypothetical protein PTSG_03249 [Salpingoeca rosetta]